MMFFREQQVGHCSWSKMGLRSETQMEPGIAEVTKRFNNKPLDFSPHLMIAIRKHNVSAKRTYSD